MFIILVIIIFAIAFISGKKLKDASISATKLLAYGAKLEFSTLGGLISLITVVLVFSLSAITILFHEVKTFLFEAFRVPFVKEDIISIGMFSVIIAMVVNFIFIALIWRNKKTNKNLK